jgi:hypothetical protein
MRSKQKSPNRGLNPKPRTCTAAAARESFLHGSTDGCNLMRLAADACCLVLPYHAARRGSSFSHSRRRPPADPHSRRQLACRRCSTAAVSRTDWSTPATGHQLQYITLIRDQQTSRKSWISALSCSETCIFSHIVQYAKKMKAVVDEQLPSYICSEWPYASSVLPAK